MRKAVKQSQGTSDVLRYSFVSFQNIGSISFSLAPCGNDHHDTDFDQLGAAATRQHFALGSEVTGEGNGNPFQYSCLENPMDGGAMGSRRPWGLEESDTMHCSRDSSCTDHVTDHAPITWLIMH